MSDKEDSDEGKEEELLSLFEGADMDLIVHDAYLCHSFLVASGYPKRDSLIFECLIWMIRKFMIEHHEMKATELDVKKDFMEGFIDRALDTVLCRHSDFADGEMIEDPYDGVERVNLVNSGDYDAKHFYTDVARGAPRI